MKLSRALREYLITDSYDRRVLRIARGKEQFPDHEFEFALGEDYNNLDFFEKREKMIEALKSLEARYERYAREIQSREINWPQLVKNAGLEILATCLDGVYVPFMMSGTRVSIEGIRERKRKPYKF